MIELMNGSCDGTHASDLLSDLGVVPRVVVIGRLERLLEFDSDKDFRKVLLLDQSWWASRGVTMAPWCPNTFLSIGQQLGKVLMIECGLVESGFLDDGMIKLLTEVLSPIFFAFTLKVDEKEFDYWVVEDGSISIQPVLGCPDSSGSPEFGQPGEDLRSHDMFHDAAMANQAIHKILGSAELSVSNDSDKVGGSSDSSSEVSLDEVACTRDGPALSHFCDGGGSRTARWVWQS
ncbi:hypothetical protein Dimus_022998 [Dionaea muscipula]